jgi:hypothetical protein
MKVRTWEDLLAKIATMSPEQRKQPIQCVQPTPNKDDVQEMLAGIAIATVEEFGFYKCRSTHDNKYNAGDFVLLMDASPFSADGAVAYELGDEIDTPIYGKDGPTAVESQLSPEALEDRKTIGGFPPHVMETIRSRTEVDIPST